MLTMRERIARCCPNVRELLDGCCEEFEEAFGITRQITSTDSETGKESTHGRFVSGTEIRHMDKDAKRLAAYTKRKVHQITMHNIEQAKCDRLDDISEQAEDWKSEWKNVTPIGIDYGIVDKDLQDMRYLEFAAILAEGAETQADAEIFEL